MKSAYISGLALALAAMILTTAAAPAATANSDKRQSVGLVLSGGGAKGVAHIGVIQALEENNIPIDYITGTSMGAIVGGLYAAGYSPAEMMQLLESVPFRYWSTGQIDPALKDYFSSEAPSPAMLYVPLTSKADSAAIDSTSVPASLISPLPMSYAFMQLFAQYTAQCGSDFDRLFVPFRCCASDVAARHKVVLSKGNFGDAIRSSMSFPIVFQPTEFEGMLLYDGGIYDNFPADVMKEDFHPDIVIGVDVSTEETGPQNSLVDQVENLVMQGSSYYLDPADGIKLKIDLNEFSLLDFPKAREIYRIGYEHAMHMIDSIKGRVTAREPQADVARRRAEFKSHTPALTFDRVDISGATEPQTRFLQSMFATRTDTFGIERATQGYYRAISTGKLSDLQPHAVYNDTTGLFALKLKASVKSDFKLGIGGYVSSSPSNYLYASAGYSTLRFNSLSAKVGAWIGQSYLAAQLNARMYLNTPIQSALDLEAVASRTAYHHHDKMVLDFDNPSFVHSYEGFGRLNFTAAAGRLATMSLGVGAARLKYSFYEPVDETAGEPFRDRCTFKLLQAVARYRSNTLNDINYPVEGRYYSFTAMGVTGTAKEKLMTYPETYLLAMSNSDNSPLPRGASTDDVAIVPQKQKQRWLQLESVTRNYFSISRHFSLGIESDVMLSTRKLMPDYNLSVVAAPSFTPTPGSRDYFNPGLRANSFVAAGVVPIYRYSENLSARLYLSGFMPLRKTIEGADGSVAYDGHKLGRPVMFGEASICYALPFATVSAYCNYISSPSRTWTAGLALGIYLQAPRFLR